MMVVHFSAAAGGTLRNDKGPTRKIQRIVTAEQNSSASIFCLHSSHFLSRFSRSVCLSSFTHLALH